MADGGDPIVLSIYERLGAFGEAIKSRAGKEDVSALYGRTQQMIAESEQRTRDLDRARGDRIRSLEEETRYHREKLEKLQKEVHEARCDLADIKEEQRDTRATLIAIRENTDAIANKRINWVDIIWRVAVAAGIIGAAISSNWTAMSSMLRMAF